MALKHTAACASDTVSRIGAIIKAREQRGMANRWLSILVRMYMRMQPDIARGVIECCVAAIGAHDGAAG